MRQAIIQKGKVLPVEVPKPVVSPGAVLIKVVNSCISAGTELAGAKASGLNLVQRALRQPKNIKKAFDMARVDGVLKTAQFISQQKDAALPTGYSLSGIVVGVGADVPDFQAGDYVAAAGAGLANHAEFVDVPCNLVVKMPDNVSFEGASTVAVGSIAMHGVRRANVQLGEFVVVFGSGLLGQLAVQMLSACGGRVIAIDLDDQRLAIAKKSGAEYVFNSADNDYIESVRQVTGGHGVDAVLFCAATENPQVLSDALTMCRRKGRLVMVGVWGRELHREALYAKEVDFLISTSYGPGRYDDKYELEGQDYPYAYVRWTENRNMLEYLRLQASGTIDTSVLLHSVFPIEKVQDAFAILASQEKPLLVLLDYGDDLPESFPRQCPEAYRVFLSKSACALSGKQMRVGFIGVGSFAKAVHLPNLLKLKDHFKIHAICSKTGLHAKEVARSFDASYATSRYQDILDDPDIDLVVICTRHNLHGRITLDSLRAGKHTFVEKPLCTKIDELEKIETFYAEGEGRDLPLLTVGFNRRFSGFARSIRGFLEKRINPVMITYRMNAGFIPYDHWVHTEEGGGRIVGEACHIIDLFSYLVGAPVKGFTSSALTPKTGAVQGTDNRSVTLEYSDGSVAVLQYLSIGNRDLPKERLEVHYDGKSIVMDDYRTMQGFGVELGRSERQPDKGFVNELEALRKCLKDEALLPIPLSSLFETTRISLAI